MITLLQNLKTSKKSINEEDFLKKIKKFNKNLKNIEIIEKDLITIFEKNKITKIDCINRKFDPNFHQAMMEIDDEKVEPGTIIQEIQSGFMFGDRLLRHLLWEFQRKRLKK